MPVLPRQTNLPRFLNPYSLADSLNWKRRVLKEQQKRRSSRPYSRGDSMDWKRCCARERAKRLAASNFQ